MSLLHTKRLNISIGNTQVCNNLNIECKAGEVWGILGRNGKGKTTLLHSLAGIYSANSGDIFLQQKNIKHTSRKQIAQNLGVLLQHHEDSFPSSVIDTVISGRHPHISRWQWESKTDWELAHQALAAVHISHLSDRPINQLSGGERQRVSIATLITQNPDIMLLDELNSHLDLKYQIQILDYLCKQAKSNNKSIIMSLHDLNLTARYCDKLILLFGEGKVITGNTDELLSEENLTQLYEHPIRKIKADNQLLFVAS